MKWDDDFRAYLKKLEEKKPVIVCGDLNVAHKEIDLKNPKTNRKNARADVGVAMGALGSDAAIEAADIVLMDDAPSKLALAVRLSRRTMKIVWQNVIFALAVKALVLVLGATGDANMWIAVFADVGVLVLAILNAMRALLVPKH